jgi:short-subunit dehydrogenase
MRLDGRTALITGAGSGIGRALAEEATRRGAKAILVGRRIGALEDTCARLPAGACRAMFACDITRATDRAALVRALDDGALPVDILVNNAGVVRAGRLAALTDEALEQVIGTNVIGTIALTRDLLPRLRRAAGARIVNVGSMYGDIGFPLFAAYAASKFALRGFSDAMRRELAAEGIGVTYVAPRATRTDAAHEFDALVEPLKMAVDDPARVAAWIWNAAERGAAAAYPPTMERIFLWVQRLCPSLIDRAARSQLGAVDANPAAEPVRPGTSPRASRPG